VLEDVRDQSDEALVAQVRQSRDADTRAFELLVSRHQRRVLANCRYMTNAHHDAEDLAQEVFVKAYFALEGFEGRSQFKTWLQRLKINHCLNYLRRRQGVTEVPLADDDDDGAQVGSQAPTITRELELRDDRARIAATLGSMGETLRVPLVLRDVDGLSYDEIAERLGIGLSAVKMRIQRGRAEFRRVFTTLGGGASKADEIRSVGA
jgi:RNA polymerase sigma-70 factor (ECF subfamily)